MSYSLRKNPASPSNFTPGRTAKINKIVIHHAATTNFDGIGSTFKNAAYGVSAHYGVGRNNNVDQYVDEKDTAWHAGNWDANCTSIGIENVNKTGAPNWEIDDKTFNTLVELVRDIAKRNGLGKLEVGKNLFGHKDFSATACPGKLYSMLKKLADKANKGTGGGAKPTPKPTKPDQVLHVGEKFKFTKTYTVDELKFVGGIWQVKTKALCPKGFTWNENGIPVMPLVEVDKNGKKTKDQVLKKGSKYTIPGTYKVLNLGSYQGIWLAEISMGGYRLWVDIKTVTEV